MVFFVLDKIGIFSKVIYYPPTKLYTTYRGYRIVNFDQNSIYLCVCSTSVLFVQLEVNQDGHNDRSGPGKTAVSSKKKTNTYVFLFYNYLLTKQYEDHTQLGKLQEIWALPMLWHIFCCACVCHSQKLLYSFDYHIVFFFINSACHFSFFFNRLLFSPGTGKPNTFLKPDNREQHSKISGNPRTAEKNWWTTIAK